MPYPIDLTGCSFGDRTFTRRVDGAVVDEGERTLLPCSHGDPFDGLRLPAGGTLRIFTGERPAGARHSAADIAMHLDAPSWTSGDTVWIKNELGQYVDTLTCVAPRTMAPAS